MNKAKIIVSTKPGLDVKMEDLIKGYHLDYTDEADLRAQYEEARKVWEEYYVTAVDGFFVLDNPKTYRDEWWENEQLMQMHYDLSQED